MIERYKSDNEYWVSPYNFIDPVRNEMDLPEHVSIHDATLRDGEQTPGVVLRKAQKVEIATRLAEVGVERIEAGMPAVSEEDFQAIKDIKRENLPSKIYTFARAITGDIDKALECGADGVVLEVPIGYPKLKYQFGWTWEDVFKKSSSVITYAKSRGLNVVFFPYDTTRARAEDLENLLKAIMETSPPDSVGVVDTMGCAIPEAIKYLVRKVKSLTGLPVEIHTHNDFGMGVATELAAVAAGAEVVHSCINGMGERTGNAALEDLLVSLKLLYGYENDYDLKKLIELSARMSEISGIPVPHNKPISGEKNYTRESGIGVDLVIKEPLAMFATSPALFGREGKIVLGKKSGKLSILYNLEKFGYEDVPEEAVMAILQKVKSAGIESRRLLSEAEFKSIVEEIL